MSVDRPTGSDIESVAAVNMPQGGRAQGVEGDWSGHKLVGAAWRGADLRNQKFVRADLSGADLSECDLSAADLRGAILRRANLSLADLAGCDFAGCDLFEANLEGADLTSANLPRATLTGANLLAANLSGANLTEADCSGAVLSSARLGKLTSPGAIFRGTTLHGASFRGADLSATDFSQASARGTSFERATLASAMLTRFQAADSIFDFADLSDVRITDGSFVSCSFLGCNCRAMQAVRSSFASSDFYWAEAGDFPRYDCDFTEARWMEPLQIAYGPSGAQLPSVVPRPLHRRPASERERRQLLEAYFDLQNTR